MKKLLFLSIALLASCANIIGSNSGQHSGFGLPKDFDMSKINLMGVNHNPANRRDVAVNAVMRPEHVQYYQIGQQPLGRQPKIASTPRAIAAKQ